ncbi:HAD family hydrolase [uncultured Traorella sp.]|uniref:HAD-IIB family hydrolase n=1 Tax=uncultured Traorella sp. TaxID=1929048 RepID=UPI0025E78816|nr:HAD family hydrolase [uncultured Traorella sp.]
MKYDELMIYTDIDGTIATVVDNVSIISDNNINAVRNFILGGGHFGVASGRGHKSIDMLFKGLEINLPYIEANGASVWDKDRDDYLSLSYVKKEDKIRIYQFVKERPNLFLTAMTDKSNKIILNDERDKRIIDYIRPTMSYEEYLNVDLLKFAILSDKDSISSIIKELDKSQILNNLSASRSADIYLELFNKNSSKGEGIKTVIRSYPNLKTKKLVCIGDFYNDISMLEIADIAICPENAKDEVKKICQHISVRNDKDVLIESLNYLINL